ncbi:YkyA family protein [Fictibacillus sp. Mic-4]|uniref:YkyA family protein n=1 Tax=Fictibacillus sp. Mic-4 TaxID=3132826 RepID=UPI003CF4DBF7
MKPQSAKTVLFAISLVTMVAFILSGCGSTDKSVARVYIHLEKSATIEKDLVKQQQSLMKLHQKERSLYNELLSLSINNEKMDFLLKEADELADKQKQLLQKEKKAFGKSYKEFKKINEIVPDLDDQKLQQKAKKVTSSMNLRYKTYNKMYDTYKDAIELNESLYSLFKEKDLNTKDYKSHIDQINEKYKEITNLNKTFNRYTKEYNQSKIAFYEAGNLDVSYKSS